MESKLGQDGSEILGAIEAAGIDLSKFFSNSAHDTKYLLGASLELAKALVTFGLDILMAILDTILDVLASLITGFKELVNQTWDIPFLSEFYKLLTDSEMSILDFCCLILAIPVTALFKEHNGKAPFASAQVSQSASAEALNTAQPWIYMSSHICLGITDSVGDLTALENASDSLGAALGAIGLIFGITAQIAGNPLPFSELVVHHQLRRAIEAARDDVYEAPNYFSHFTWYFQFAGLFLALLGAGGGIIGLKGSISDTDGFKRYDSVIKGVIGLFGGVHLALMSILWVADNSKINTLEGGTIVVEKGDGSAPDDRYPDGVRAMLNSGQKSDVEIFNILAARGNNASYWTLDNDQTELIRSASGDEKDLREWLEDAKDYQSWGSGGNAAKLLTNVMTTLPSISKIGLISKLSEGEPAVPVIVALIDLVAHETEAGVFGKRITSDALK